jgi:AAA ATPase domain
MVGRAAARAGSDAPSPASICPPRLVGREAETSQLAAALASPAALVLVEGEAGIGKSRLVREFLRSRDAGELMTCGLEVSDSFTDLGEAVQAVARHMARVGVYDIRVSYLAS